MNDKTIKLIAVFMIAFAALAWADGYRSTAKNSLLVDDGLRIDDLLRPAAYDQSHTHSFLVEGVPVVYDGEFLVFTHAERDGFHDEMVRIVKKELSVSRLSDEQQDQVGRFTALIPHIETLRRQFKRETDRWPHKCHEYAARLMEVLDKGGADLKVRRIERNRPTSPFHPSRYLGADGNETMDVWYPSVGSSFVSYHTFIVCTIAGVDFIVDIAADQFEPCAPGAKEYRDRGIVIIPWGLVHANKELRRRFWMYATGALRDVDIKSFPEPADAFDICARHLTSAGIREAPSDTQLIGRLAAELAQEYKPDRAAAVYWILARFALGNMTSADAQQIVHEIYDVAQERAVECITRMNQVRAVEHIPSDELWVQPEPLFQEFSLDLHEESCV